MSEKLEYKFPTPYFPDWDEVDDEYRYRAFDKYGELFYYAGKPKLCKGLGNWTIASCNFELKGKASWRWSQKIWHKSLEKRPQSQTEK